MRSGESIEMLVDRIKSEGRVAIVPGSPRWFGEGAAGHVRLPSFSKRTCGHCRKTSWRHLYCLHQWCRHQ